MQIITGKTKLIAVIGDPISHSASPKMQNQMLKYNNLDYIYVPFNVKIENLKTAIHSMKALNITGFNVTIPHKENVLPFLDELDSLAKSIGAVNTIVNKNNKLIGYNTDGDGFLLSLKEELNYSVVNKNVVIIGAGGSAKSIIYSLSKQPIGKLSIINRTLNKAEEIEQKLHDTHTKCHELKKSLSKECCDDLQYADLIINTTSMGMTPYENISPLQDYSWAHDKQLFYDIIYNPEETIFLKEAKKRNATILNGLGMLAGQGKLAFELFTGKKADYFTMKKELE